MTIKQLSLALNGAVESGAGEQEVEFYVDNVRLTINAYTPILYNGEWRFTFYAGEPKDA